MSFVVVKQRFFVEKDNEENLGKVFTQNDQKPKKK